MMEHVEEVAVALVMYTSVLLVSGGISSVTFAFVSRIS